MKTITVSPPRRPECQRYTIPVAFPCKWFDYAEPAVYLQPSVEAVVMQAEDFAIAYAHGNLVVRIWQGHDAAGNLYQAWIEKFNERPDWAYRNAMEARVRAEADRA